MRPVSRYTFTYANGCRLCGAVAARHKVIGRRLNRSQGSRPWRLDGIAVSVKRCGECGLVYADPMPVPFDLQDHYGVAPEQYWDQDYLGDITRPYQWLIQRARDMMPSIPTPRMLDVGAGVGKAMRAFQEAGFDTHGIEPSEPFRRQAIERMGIDAERLQLASIESADYPAGHFDLITFHVVLEHVPEPEKALIKSLQWLRPGGFISIEVPSARWLVNRIANTYYRMRGTDYVANLSPMHEPFHLYEFTLKSFATFARENGAEVAHHQYFVCDTFMPQWMDLLLKPVMRWTDTGMEMNVWLRKR